MRTLRTWMAAHRPRSRYARLRDELAALDRGVIDAGVTASRALARTAKIEDGILDAYRAACRPLPEDDKPVPARDAGLILIRGGTS